ncbi:MAG: site-specific integrase [Euzebyaceae bacterium]|nr:site-specific integrase [Euzebyaceae bacterium]
MRPTSLARIDSAVRTQILPEWGATALSGITNADVRAWAARLHASGYSASTVRKAVFTLRRILAAAVADRRLAVNAAENVPLPVDEPGEQRYLTADEVEVLADAIEPRFRAMVLVAAYGGLRFGELTALRRERVDLLRGRVQVAETLVQVGAELSFGPTKTRKGRRTVPLPRRVCNELAEHLEQFVPPPADALVFTGVFGQPLRREWFRRTWWLPAVKRAGLEGLRFHDMRVRHEAPCIRVGCKDPPPGCRSSPVKLRAA